MKISLRIQVLWIHPKKASISSWVCPTGPRFKTPRPKWHFSSVPFRNYSWAYSFQKLTVIFLEDLRSPQDLRSDFCDLWSFRSMVRSFQIRSFHSIVRSFHKKVNWFQIWKANMKSKVNFSKFLSRVIMFYLKPLYIERANKHAGYVVLYWMSSFLCCGQKSHRAEWVDIISYRHDHRSGKFEWTSAFNMLWIREERASFCPPALIKLIRTTSLAPKWQIHHGILKMNDVCTI